MTTPITVDSDGSTGGSGDLVMEEASKVVVGGGSDLAVETHDDVEECSKLQPAPIPTVGSLASASTATSVQKQFPSRAMPLPAAPRGCSFGGGLCELVVVEAIQEYLTFHGMEDSIRCLNEDVESRSKAVSSSRAGTVENEGRGTAARQALVGSELAVARALADFDAGRRDDLFETWNMLVPAVASDSPKGCALELRLRVHFGVYATRQALSATAAAKLDAPAVPEPDFEDLKTFLAAHPAANLDDTAESLAPLFALPFVPQPHSRPGFKFIFEDTWAQKLRSDLQAFLTPHASARHAPMLRHLAGNLLIARGPKTAPPPGSWHELVRIADLGLAAAARIHDVQNAGAALGGGVRRGANLFKDISHARWRLASVAAQPDVPPPAPTSAQAQRAMGSFATDGPELPMGPDRLWPCSREAISSLDASNIKDASYRDALRSPPKRLHSARNLESRARTATALLPVPPALDFGRIAAVIAGDAAGPEQPPPLHAVLMAVLRRLALPDEPVRPRRTFLAAFACFGALRALAERLGGIINNGDEVVSEIALAVLAVCACEAVGRKEIEQAEMVKSGCLAALVMVLQRAVVGSPVHIQCLAVLQRLSLRRRLQSQMIGLGAVDWVLQTLRCVRCPDLAGSNSGSWQAPDEAGAPDFSLEFASALLMNLTLRTAGRRRCLDLDAYEVLIRFIEHPNPQVRTHVNGSLYSLLGVPSFRAAAQQKNAEALFRSALMRVPAGDNLLKRQLDFLLTQLSRNGGNGVDEDSDSEADKGAEGDVDDGENFLDEEELAGHFLLVSSAACAAAAEHAGEGAAAGEAAAASAAAAAEAAAAEEALRLFRVAPGTGVADTQQRRFHAFIACSAGGLCSPIGKRRSRLSVDIMGGSPSPYGPGPGMGPLLSPSPPPLLPTAMEMPSLESSPVNANRNVPNHEVILEKPASSSVPSIAVTHGTPVHRSSPVHRSLQGTGLDNLVEEEEAVTAEATSPTPAIEQEKPPVGAVPKARETGQKSGSAAPGPSRLRPPRIVSENKNSGASASRRNVSPADGESSVPDTNGRGAGRAGNATNSDAGAHSQNPRAPAGSNSASRGRSAAAVPAKGIARNATSAPPSLLPPLVTPASANVADSAVRANAGARNRSRSSTPATGQHEAGRAAVGGVSVAQATAAAAEAALAAGGAGGQKRRPPKSVPPKNGGAAGDGAGPSQKSSGTSSLPHLPMIPQRRGG